MSSSAWTNSSQTARMSQHDEAAFNTGEVRDCLKQGTLIIKLEENVG